MTTDPRCWNDLATANAALRAENRRLFAALRDVTAYAEAQVCTHEETHRGGTIWEICDDCGAKWADDMGGKPEFSWPCALSAAQSAIAATKEPTDV